MKTKTELWLGETLIAKSPYITYFNRVKKCSPKHSISTFEIAFEVPEDTELNIAEGAYIKDIETSRITKGVVNSTTFQGISCTNFGYFSVIFSGDVV